MKSKLAVGAVLVAALLFAQGCMGRAISEGAGAALGPKGKVVVLSPIVDSSAKPLGVYQRFEMERFVDSMDGQAPPDLNQYLAPAFAKELLDDRIPEAAYGKTLLIRGKFIHYETGDMLDQAFGPLEEVIARVELVDKDSGKVIGVANCIGRTKETVRMGVKNKADGLAKAIAGWIGKNYPDNRRTPKKRAGDGEG